MNLIFFNLSNPQLLYVIIGNAYFFQVVKISHICGGLFSEEVKDHINLRYQDDLGRF